MTHATTATAPATTTSYDRALAKYGAANKIRRRPASGKRLGQAAYAAASHVVVTYAVLDGVRMRIEQSAKWGTVCTPCNKESL